MPPKKYSPKKAGRPKGKLGKALEKLKSKPRQEEDEEDLIFLDDEPEKPNRQEEDETEGTSFKEEDEPGRPKEPPKTRKTKPPEEKKTAPDDVADTPQPPIQEKKNKIKVGQKDFEEIIKKALQEQLKAMDEAKKAEREAKRAERDKSKQDFIKKKQEEKKKRDDERKAEKKAEQEYMAKLILQREADMNRAFSANLGRVRQRLIM